MQPKYRHKIACPLYFQVSMGETKDSHRLRKVCITLITCLTVLVTPALSQSSSFPNLTHADLQEILNRIDSDLFSNRPIALATTVRLGFHDCVSGCDGSVNLFATQNRGLEGVKIRIHDAYETGLNSAFYKTYLSYSDFVVLVTSRAVGHGLRAGSPSVPYVNSTPHFYYGRPDGPTWNADPSEATIVDASDNWPDVEQFRSLHLQPVTENDMIALLGLHGMGECTTHNSGYNGPWGPRNDRNVINNNFYRNLLSLGDNNENFVQVQVPEPNDPAPTTVFPSDPPEFDEIQWERRRGPNGASPQPNEQAPPEPGQPGGGQRGGRGGGRGGGGRGGPRRLQGGGGGGGQGNQRQMMLNVDMGIYLEFTANDGNVTGRYCGQGTRTTLSNCTEADRLSVHPVRGQLAHNFATNQDFYRLTVQEAFIKMTQVRSSGHTDQFKTITAQKTCVGGVQVCLGDLFFSNCAGQANISC